MRLLTRLLVLTVTTVATFAGGTAGSAFAAEDMSVEQAGSYYLSAVCPVNAADHKFDYAMFRGRDSVTLRQMRNRLAATKRAARADSNAHYTFARTLTNPPAAWPANVQPPVATLTTKSLRLSIVYGHIAAARTARGVFYWYDRLAAPTRAAALPARTIRANLNLPNVGSGC